MLGRQPTPSFAELVLVGPGAADLRRSARDPPGALRQRGRGRRDHGRADRGHREPASPRCWSGDATPAVIFADDRLGAGRSDLSATLLAARHPDLDDLPVDADHLGAGAAADHGAALPVRPDHRAARGRRGGQLGAGGPGGAPGLPRQPGRPATTRPSRPSGRGPSCRRSTAPPTSGWSPRPWPARSPSAAPGDRFRPTRAETASTAVPPDQLEQMARLEHESWRRFYLEHGLALRGDPRRRPPGAQRAPVPWDELSADYRQRAVRQRHATP